MIDLVAAVLMLCTAQGQCESHPLKVERKACGFHVQAERADLGRGTITVKCGK